MSALLVAKRFRFLTLSDGNTNTDTMMKALNDESNCSSPVVPPASIVVNGSGIETHLPIPCEVDDQSHSSSSNQQQRAGHRRRRKSSHITMAGRSFTRSCSARSLLSSVIFVLAIGCLLVGASANVPRNVPLSTVPPPPPPPSPQQQQQQQEQLQHSRSPVVVDRRFVEGPLAAGLHVSGGSRLKRAARRVRRFRDVRMERGMQLQHDRNVRAMAVESQVSAATASVSSSYQAPSRELYPPTQGVSVFESTHSMMESSDNTGSLMVSTAPPELHPSTTNEEGVVVIEQQLPASVLPTQPSSALNQKAIMFMSLLAVQFGIQPILVRKFMPQGICKSSVVLTQELLKFAMAYVGYKSTTTIERRSEEISSLNFSSWLAMAGVPAILYTVQNLASLLAYQNLEALTFNVLNQTKILSAALCCYLVMGKKQTKMQSVSLVLLLASALVMEKVISIESIMATLFLGRGSGVGGGLPSLLSAWQSMSLGRRFTHGVVPVLLASFISGLAGALVQRSLQGGGDDAALSPTQRKPKNSYLFSMELTSASVIVLLGSLFLSGDGRIMLSNGFFHQWTPGTMIPILTNSMGGILVGLVTKHAGSVRKGFALIFGILLSGLLQAVAGTAGVSSAQIMGGILAAASLWLHAKHAPGKG